MGRHCQLKEDRRTDNNNDGPCDEMDTDETPANDNMQISSDNVVDGTTDPGHKSNDESISPSPDGLVDAQPSSSGCSNSTIEKKTEKKKLVQKCLKELREFLRSNSSHETNTISETKTSTLETLTQILDLLKNTHSNLNRAASGSMELSHPRRLLSPALSYKSHNYLDIIADEDKDLQNNSSAITIELNQDGIISDFSFKNSLHPDLSWMESLDLRGKLFSDIIDSDDRHLYLMQTISIGHSEQKSGYLKLKNVDRDSISISTPCKVVIRTKTGHDGSKRIVSTVLPLDVIGSCESSNLSSTFFTKHSSDCRFIDVDSKVAILWGYLPQELLGHSFLSFITDDSCDIFESSHDQAIKARGKAVRSNAYQFIVRNGNLITMQTEWSLFVNPWTKLVDFVIGCHNIVEGCHKRDMFRSIEERIILSTEKAQLVQSKIKTLLSQPFAQKLKTKPASNQKSSTVCKSASSKHGKPDTKEDSVSVSKGKPPCRHMSTFFDRIVEHEYFMADSAPVHDDFWKKGSPQGSLPASGDGSSGSPPESSGSGPSYNEITRLENVTRLLKSQEGHSSDDSSNEKCPKSASCSPVDRGTDVVKPLQPVQNSSILEALYSNPTSVQNMHRSHSAAANLDHCRQSTVKLTSEILQTFTKEQERQYKANWKRRFSVELQHVALKRALEPPIADITCNSQKISRPEVYRPASMPVIARPNEPCFYNPLTSPVSTWSSPSPVISSVLPVKSNSVNYYRSLGPTPAPPPGKNFQITSAPLPSSEGFPVVIADALSPRQSAFAPLLKKQPDPVLYGVSTTNYENWNGSMIQQPQPINLSVRPDLPFQTSVIQSGSDGMVNRSSWLNAPCASASVTLQRMTQTSRLAREAQWPLPSVPRSVPMTDDFLFRFQYNNNNTNNNNSNCHDVLQNDPNRLFSMPQQRSVVNSQFDRVYNENAFYANQSYNTNTDVSPIREATESLMLLEEI